MIPSRDLLDAFYRVYNDLTCERIYPDELHARLASEGANYTLYTATKRKRKKSSEKAKLKGGRVIGTDDGRYWIAMKNCWARNDRQGRIAAEAYERVYAGIEERAVERGPQDKVYQRVKYFNQWHPDQIIETPLEAKHKYLTTGYIPDYIDRNGIE